MADNQTEAVIAITSEALLADLLARGLDVELLTPGVPMPTVPLAAAAIGVRDEQILKTLLFRDRAGQLVIVIANGVGRVSRERLAAACALDRPKLAGPETMLRATGFPAGGVSPVGHRLAMRVVMDRQAAALDMAYGGGGREEALLRIRPADILRLTNAEILDVVDPPATP